MFKFLIKIEVSVWTNPQLWNEAKPLQIFASTLAKNHMANELDSQGSTI